MDVPHTFVEAIQRTAAHRPDRGVRFYATATSSERITYADLDRIARADAKGLAEAGYGPGDVAVLAFGPGHGFIRAALASMYAGMAFAPVPITVSRDPAAIGKRLGLIVADAGSRIILTDDDALASFPDAGQLLRGVADVHVLPDPAPERAEAWTPPAIDADSTAILQYTSGSTGRPKGVTITHGNLIANQEAMGKALRMEPDDSLVGWLPHYHDMGLIGALLGPIYHGCELTLTSPAQFLRRPLLWLRLISEHRATITVGPDFAFNLCARLTTPQQLGELDLSSLRLVITGAEPVRGRTLQSFSDRFAPTGFRPESFAPAYGMAETTLLVSVHLAPDAVSPLVVDAAELESGRLAPADGERRTAEVVPCGPVAPKHTVAIVDPATGAACAPGQFGEIWVSGPSVSVGYWRNPEATAETFGARMPDGDADYLRTGDLGVLVDGELFITGRIKDLIIIRGRNIYPQDLEETAARVAAAMGVGISAAFEVGDDQRVHLVAEVDPTVSDEEDLRTVAETVTSAVTTAHELPALTVSLIRRGSLPRTTSGKVQRSLTRTLVGTGAIPVLMTAGSGAGGSDR